MTEGQKLSAYVGREPTEREVLEQWERIEERLGAKPPSRSYRLAAVAALVVVFAAIGFTVENHRRQVASAWDGAVLDSGADQVSVALGDGSHIELMPASQVRVVEGTARAVHLDLRKGSARFDVTHVPGRTFVVKSGNVTIRVVGTKFTVTTLPLPGGERITVAVDRGVVEAEGVPGAEPTRIRAGETWSTVQTAVTTAKQDESPAPSATPGAKAPEAVPADTAPVPAAPSAAAVLDRPQAAPERAVKPEPSAQELFEAANRARQSGDARGAAASYEALLRLHPTDARVGLAAFELGRLRMDQLGDARGAVTALLRAVSAAPGSGFREDALARLVQAYGTLGIVPSCSKMQSAYLASYPKGVHAAAVRKACGGSP